VIFVDYNVFRPSKKWKKKARKQLRQLIVFQAAGNIAQRNIHIDARQYVWSEIKAHIIKVTYNKCWFSEGGSDVSHFHIEHFRPKKLVEILPAKFGCAEARPTNEPNSYWWMAFNYKNFRICGQIVNSYKGNYFPLAPGSITCNSLSSNINLEQVILLDPAVQADTDLLTFDINGMPVASANPMLNPYGYLRADLSIKVYGLKDGLVIEARKRKLADLNILIDKINRYYQLLIADPTNAALMEIIQTECSFLVAMSKGHQPFSKMAKVRIEFIPYQWAIDFVHPFL
jgi:hypothetical protein